MSPPDVDVGDELPLTLPRLLAARADAHPDKHFVVCDASKLGYTAVERRSAELARALLAVGAGKGTHVGVLMPNSPEFVLVCLAAMRIGAVAVPLHAFSKPDELGGLLRAADVEIVVSARQWRSHDCQQTLSGAIEGLDLASGGVVQSAAVPLLRHLYIDAPSGPVHRDHHLAFLLDAATRVDEEVLASIELDVMPSDPAVIVFTSSSMGTPTGVVYNHGPLIRHLDNLCSVRRFAVDEIVFSDSPWFWTGGFAYALIATLVAGTRLVCSNDDVHPQDPTLRHQPYGFAETAGVCLAHTDPSELPEHPRGSVGRPVPGFEAKIVDPDTGADCHTDEIGELWLRSPLSMDGYCGRERFDVFEPDGWLRIGERFHRDSDGRFHFHGTAPGSRQQSESIDTGPTLPALLRDHARQIGSRPAMVHDDASISYRELDQRSHQLACRLVAAGIGKHVRVGLLMPNGIDWAIVACALMRVGAVLVPLSTLLKPPELEAQLRGASVTHLIAARRYRGRDYLDEIAQREPALLELGSARLRHPRLPALRQVWPADALPENAAPSPLVEALEAAVRPADDLAILFTSGSRGAPKGVLHSHGNALRAVASGLDARCVHPAERLYIPMPFFWMGGFGGGLLTAFVAGGTLLTESDPTPASTIAFLERERATLFRGWPDQAAKVAADPSFAKADLSSLGPGSLGAVLPEGLRPKPGARANLFGMTETFGPYSGSRGDTDMPKDKWGSCGKPLEGVEVRVVDPDSAKPLPAGEPGEIQVRGPNLMRGIVGRLREAIFTADSFYPTGDLGLLDADGYLFYQGRRDDMFKVSGATVYPTEVEAALRTVPGVAQAYVTNLTEPTGELVGAAVVARELGVADLDRETRARLSAFKVPKRWVLLDSPAEVPTMATGKIDKSGLQQLIRRNGKAV